MINVHGLPPADAAWRHQRPGKGEIVVDHVAHFVPDMDAAATALTALGFTLTPLSIQQHRIEPGAPLVPAGTANRCVMLRSGYLEFLTPIADTLIAARMRAAIARHVGLHLVCFGTDDAAAVHDRLGAAAFAPQPPVALERSIGTPDGDGLARFTVIRVPAETMPEGRIQFVEHHTPELLWQARWVDHSNGALGLAAAVICADQPDEAALRYERFTGLTAVRDGATQRLDTARGSIVIVDPATFERRFGTAPPAPPSIAATIIDCVDAGVARDRFASAGLSPIAIDRWRVAVAPSPAVGGLFVFQVPGAPPLRWT